VEPEQCILIADDSEADVMSLRRAFKQLGFIGLIKAVENGADAIAYLRGDGKFADRVAFPFPDLLLLDLKMPATNGFEVLQWLRSQRDEIGMLRTVVLTTSDEIKDVNAAYAIGANSFLTKPLGFTEFKDCIEVVMKYWLNVSRAPQITVVPQAENVVPTQAVQARGKSRRAAGGLRGQSSVGGSPTAQSSASVRRGRSKAAGSAGLTK
jgi:CheY-like chemotaxis protein